MGLFGKTPTPAERVRRPAALPLADAVRVAYAAAGRMGAPALAQVREWQSKLRAEGRQLDRAIRCTRGARSRGAFADAAARSPPPGAWSRSGSRGSDGAGNGQDQDVH